MHIGIVGLGVMGKAFASNLLDAGHKVFFWNRNELDKKRFTDKGGIFCENTLEVFEKSEIILSVLSNDQSYEDVFLNSELIDKIPKNKIHCNMATISVACHKKLHLLHNLREQYYIASPVLGNSTFAEKKLIHILAAGNNEIIKHYESIFLTLGKTLRIVGDLPEYAAILKIAINYLLCSAVTSLSEAHALVSSYSIPAIILQEIIDNTFLGSPAYQLYGNKIVNSQFEPAAFRMDLALKDLKLFIDSKLNSKIDFPLSEVLIDRLELVVKSGNNFKDLSALFLLYQTKN